MAAPKGNNYNKKWKTAEERKKACARFCEHVAKGYTVNCFPDADWDTVKRYMKEFPKDFVPDQIKEAKRKGRALLEGAGLDAILGKNKDFNSKAWQFTMMNKYGWSTSKKEDITSGGEKLKYVWGTDKPKPKKPSKK